MSITNPLPRREVVGSFSSRPDLDRALAALADAGFSHTDLSLLASHGSIDAAKPETVSLRERLRGLLGEMTYEGPLVTAGLIAIATGEIGAVIAGLIAAGVGGVALKEMMEELTAGPHAGEFARALAAGDILLWVTVSDQAREDAATRCLVATGAANIHVNARA